MIRIGEKCKLTGEAQEWWDSHDSLQTQYGAAFHFAVGDEKKGSEVVLSADAYEYNIDVYQNPGGLPILPWNDDLLFKLYYKTAR